MQIRNFKPEEQLITYGDQGKEYFILAEGRVRVLVYEPGTSPYDPDLAKKVKLTKELPQGSGFGELALIHNDKRSATIEAIDECEAYVLDGQLFKQMVTQDAVKRRDGTTSIFS
jgi:CRP-like cAMP-binding protein